MQDKKSLTGQFSKFSPHFDSLVTFSEMPNDTSHENFWIKKKFVQISHVPVAVQLLRELRKEPLSSVVAKYAKETYYINVGSAHMVFKRYFV